MSDSVFRVVDKDGKPANYRNNRRKNVYTEERFAKSAATQFNKITVWDHVNVCPKQLDGAPFDVQEGKVEWL